MIPEAEKINPFYANIAKEIPTLIFMEMLNDYRKRNIYSELSFLNSFTFVFDEDRNKINIFYLKKHFDSKQPIKSMKGNVSLGEKSYRNSQNPELIIEEYIKNLYAKFMKPFVHDYIGHIQIKIKDGYTIEDIEFKKSTYMFKIFVNEETSHLVQYYCSKFGRV